MVALISFFVFVLGLIVGSFLNAVIYRLEVGDSAFRGRSYCPHCKHELAWHDLIPVLSFAMLGGKCRYCGKSISIQYPVVELATALIFLAIFNFEFLIFNEFSNVLILQTLYLFAITSLLIVLFVYDLRHYILPDKILLPAIFVVSIWYFVSSIFFESYTRYEILNTVYPAIGAAAFFLVIYLLSRGRAMGFGDVKLALFMGLFLGFPHILVALFIAFLLGAIIGIILIGLRKKKLKSEIPFGPFLIAGTFIALLWGDSIIEYLWYFRI